MNAIAQSFTEPAARLNACDELVDAFQTYSAFNKAEASAWRLRQDDFLLSNARPAKREDAAVLVAAVIKRMNADWLFHKYEKASTCLRMDSD